MHRIMNNEYHTQRFSGMRHCMYISIFTLVQLHWAINHAHTHGWTGSHVLATALRIDIGVLKAKLVILRTPISMQGCILLVYDVILFPARGQEYPYCQISKMQQQHFLASGENFSIFVKICNHQLYNHKTNPGYTTATHSYQVSPFLSLCCNTVCSSCFWVL